MIEEVSITEEQKNNILTLQEGHFVDLKAIEIAPAKLTRTVSAFANAEGGELYVGIDENKQTGERAWRGFANVESANGFIQIFEALFPLGDSFSYIFLKCSGALGLVLKVEVRKTHDIKKASDKIPYIRRGAQNLPITTPEDLRRLELNKGITTFEVETVPVDKNLITNSVHIIQFMLEVIPTNEPEIWLRKQQLIRDEKPTVAGVLLFAEEPQALLPKRCAIKIYRYKTIEKEGTRDTLAFDPITIEGNLYEQIGLAIEKTVEVIETIPVLGEEGLERFSYPRIALHEIITNAVLHRDYSIADDVHVRIFDNRIEIESPGKLPGHVTVENILRERFARNPALVRLINKFPDPPNKDVGEGLNTAFEEMRKLRLKDPLIIEDENSVVVVIKHEPLASPDNLIMEFLENNPEINNRTARKICHIGDANDMKRIFARMIASGLIERIEGPGRGGGSAAYRKKVKQD